MSIRRTHTSPPHSNAKPLLQKYYGEPLCLSREGRTPEKHSSKSFRGRFGRLTPHTPETKPKRTVINSPAEELGHTMGQLRRLERQVRAEERNTLSERQKSERLRSELKQEKERSRHIQKEYQALRSQFSRDRSKWQDKQKALERELEQIKWKVCQQHSRSRESPIKITIAKEVKRKQPEGCKCVEYQQEIAHLKTIRTRMQKDLQKLIAEDRILREEHSQQKRKPHELQSKVKQRSLKAAEDSESFSSIIKRHEQKISQEFTIKVNGLNREIAHLKVEKREAEQQCQQAKDLIKVLKSQLIKSKQESSYKHSDNEEKRVSPPGNVDDLRRDIKVLEIQRQSLRKEIDHLIKDKIAQQAQPKPSENKPSYSALIKQKNDLLIKVKELQNKLQDGSQSYAKGLRDLEHHFVSQINDLQTKNDKLQTLVKNLEKSITENERMLTQMQVQQLQLEKLKKGFSQLEKLKFNNELEIRKLKVQVDKAKVIRQQGEIQSKKQQQTLNSLISQNANTSNNLKMKEQEIRQLQLDHLIVSKKLQTASRQLQELRKPAKQPQIKHLKSKIQELERQINAYKQQIATKDQQNRNSKQSSGENQHILNISRQKLNIDQEELELMRKQFEDDKIKFQQQKNKQLKQISEKAQELKASQYLFTKRKQDFQALNAAINEELNRKGEQQEQNDRRIQNSYQELHDERVKFDDQRKKGMLEIQQAFAEIAENKQKIGNQLQKIDKLKKELQQEKANQKGGKEQQFDAFNVQIRSLKKSNQQMEQKHKRQMTQALHQYKIALSDIQTRVEASFQLLQKQHLAKIAKQIAEQSSKFIKLNEKIQKMQQLVHSAPGNDNFQESLQTVYDNLHEIMLRNQEESKMSEVIERDVKTMQQQIGLMQQAIRKTKRGVQHLRQFIAEGKAEEAQELLLEIDHTLEELL